VGDLSGEEEQLAAAAWGLAEVKFTSTIVAGVFAIYKSKLAKFQTF